VKAGKHGGTGGSVIQEDGIGNEDVNRGKRNVLLLSGKRNRNKSNRKPIHKGDLRGGGGTCQESQLVKEGIRLCKNGLHSPERGGDSRITKGGLFIVDGGKWQEVAHHKRKDGTLVRLTQSAMG